MALFKEGFRLAPRLIGNCDLRGKSTSAQSLISIIRSKLSHQGQGTKQKTFAKKSTASPTFRHRHPGMAVSSSATNAAGDSQEEKLVICVEGNIGCGKTTLLNYFQNVGGCEVLSEPVEKWRNLEGYNVLELMYQDPCRWSMALQTYVQLTMLQHHTKPQTVPVRLMERSIHSAKYCFLNNLHTSGRIPELEYVILTEWFDWITKTQDTKVDLIVYLRTDPELLHERIMKRCRQEEKSIPFEYLKTLHTLHEDWLIHKKHPCPEVLVLDANQTLEEMEGVYEQHKSHILKPALRRQASSV